MPIKIIAENRKARHDYIIVDQYEAGLVMTGTEVQSLRLGKVNLKDSYARVKNGEVFLYQVHISPYPFAYYNNHDPLRVRKLLLHKREILRLYAKANEQGHTLVGPSKSTSRPAKPRSPSRWPRASANSTNARASATANRSARWTACASSADHPVPSSASFPILRLALCEQPLKPFL